MSKPIALRDHVASGMVRAQTVDAITAMRAGEPVVTHEPFWAKTPYRCWTRLQKPDGCWTRNLGQYRATVQEAADDLLAKLRDRAAGRG